jgi:hypothetical protein
VLSALGAAQSVSVLSLRTGIDERVLDDQIGRLEVLDLVHVDAVGVAVRAEDLVPALDRAADRFATAGTGARDKERHRHERAAWSGRPGGGGSREMRGPM